MRESFFEIPEYHRYLSPNLARATLDQARPVEGVSGLKAVGETREDPEALRFLVELYRETRSDLGRILRQRRLDRDFLDARTRACAELNRRRGVEISDPDYQTVIGLEDAEGRIVIGPLGEHYCRAGGARVAPIPSHLQGSHVTLFGPPDSAKLAVNAMNAYHRRLPGEPQIVEELLAALSPESASPKWGADDEDSKTPMRGSLVSAAENLRGCFEGDLTVIDEARGKTYEIADSHLALPIKRFPGFALPCPFLFLEESPIPLHLYDFALHLFAHRSRPEALTFYVPKLENEEEAAYLHTMISHAERLISQYEPSYQRGTVRLMIVLENPRAILRAHEIMDALYPYFVGASLGWHDYLGSTARLFKEDSHYRIPVKADPDIVIKYIKASHRLVADVVGSRGGVKVGGMYGILPVSSDLRSPSFQITLLGYFRDVITQMKRDLTGFWVAHPDFVRLGLALVQAWKLRVAGDPAPLRQLCEQILSPPYAEEIERFIEGPDIEGLDLDDPGYVRSLIVADLKESDTISNHDPEEVRYNVFQSLQYLVDWLSGNGCVALPASVRDTPVRVMDDLATAERSRWEVWHEVYHGRVRREELIQIAFEELRFIRKDLSNDQKIVQVKWDERTAKWYPVAFHLMLSLMTTEDPPEFATELLLPFTLDVIRDATDPLKAARTLDPNRYELDPWVARFCHFFEVCGATRFATESADTLAYDPERARALIESFSKEEIIEAASFHGDIGEPKRGLDALAMAEQAGVSDHERETLSQLRELGEQYRERFGMKFLISARGRSGAELLEALRARLDRSEADELDAARSALWEITETRLSLDPPDQLAEHLESIRSAYDLNAVSVAVTRGEEIQSIALGDCVPSDHFQIASLSKTLGSIFTLDQLARAGLTPDLSVNELLAQLGSTLKINAAQTGDEIDPHQLRVWHLMSHFGLNQHYVGGFPGDERFPEVRELLDGFPARGYERAALISPPGTHFQYSGAGFLVLEHLAELLSGVSASDGLNAHFSSLTTSDFSFGHRGDGAASGYFDDGQPIPGGAYRFPAFAAGVSTSARELLHILQHLAWAYQRPEGSGPISHDVAAHMLRSRDLGCRDFMGCEIGLGVFTIEAGENRFMLHQGANDGFRALYLHCFEGPNRDQGFVILANGDDRAVRGVTEIAWALIESLDISGVDLSRSPHHPNANERSAFSATFNEAEVPQEQRVNLGYKELLFSAFAPQLPSLVHTRGPLDAHHEWNLAASATITRVSDQRFARASNLFSLYAPTFDPEHYCRQGKVMDSWESARHNEQDVEYMEFTLPEPTQLRYLTFSTQFHDGNHVERARLLCRAASSAPHEAGSSVSEWVEVTPWIELEGHSLFHVALPEQTPSSVEFRLETAPDGGLSRLHLFATLPESERGHFLPLERARAERFLDPIPTPRKPLTIPYRAPASGAELGSSPKSSSPLWRFGETRLVDWASRAMGGRVLRASNQHYGPADQVISPYPPLHMFDGFESARSRTEGHREELELSLGRATRIHRIILDMSHFVNNAPQAIRVWMMIDEEWIELVPQTSIKEFSGNIKVLEVNDPRVAQHLKLEIFPDGGINRVHVLGAE